MYVELPQGIKAIHGSSKDHVLKLLTNLYDQKQVVCIWNQYMVKNLKEIGFVQSLIDECVFYHDDIIFIVYIID